GEVLPRAGDAGDVGLPAQPAFRADLARHAGHLGGEGVELIDHRVHRVLDLQDLALGIDGDLARQVAVGDRGRDLGDVADLRSEVARQPLVVAGEVFPGAGDAGDFGLPAELALGADLARDAGHLGGEGVELIDHRVDGVLELENLALDVDGDLPGEVTVGDGGGDVRDVADLVGELTGHQVDVVGEVFPGAGDSGDLRLSTELALSAHLASDARHFEAEGAELVDHRVHDPRRFQELTLQAATVDVGRHRLREVTFGDRVDDARHLAVRPHHVLDQVVDRIQGGGPGAAGVADRRVLDLAFLAHVLAESFQLALEPLVG